MYRVNISDLEDDRKLETEFVDFYGVKRILVKRMGFSGIDLEVVLDELVRDGGIFVYSFEPYHNYSMKVTEVE